MIRAFCAFAFLVFSTVAFAAPLTLHSAYEVAGTNPDGSKYSGTVNVKVISEASFTIHWKIAGESYDGFGMRNGDALAATYEINGEPGLVIYRVDDKGDLNGLWVVRGKDNAGSEHLTPAD